MVIDKILDRKDNIEPYNAKAFYDAMVQYGADKIALAMDSGEEVDVQNELCAYIIENGYNRDLCVYVRCLNWL